MQSPSVLPSPENKPAGLYWVVTGLHGVQDGIWNITASMQVLTGLSVFTS